MHAVSGPKTPLEQKHHHDLHMTPRLVLDDSAGLAGSFLSFFRASGIHWSRTTIKYAIITSESSNMLHVTSYMTISINIIYRRRNCLGGPCKAFAMQTTLQFAHRIGGEDCTKLLMRLRKTMCAVLWCLLCFMFHVLFQGGVCESESSLGRCRWFLHVSTAPFTYMHVDLGAELGNCPRRLGHKQTKCVRTLKMLMRSRHFAARL